MGSGSFTDKIKGAMSSSKNAKNGKANAQPPNNKPHQTATKKDKNKAKRKRSGKKDKPEKTKADRYDDQEPMQVNGFVMLHNDANLDLDAGQGKTQIPPQAPSNNATGGEGFISLDMDDSDDAKSVHNNTFAAFEEDLENRADDGGDGEEAEDYTPAGVKRKRDDSNSSIKSAGDAEFPWIRDHDRSNNREMADWLTYEIRDFVAYMSPSAHEIEARNAAVRRIRNLVHEMWHDAEAHVFGSYATDLYLPGSDIDMVVLSNSSRYADKKSLYQLSSRLRGRGIAKSMEVIAKARVPIIKFVDVKTNIHIDISFERRNGIDAVNTIKSWLRQYPSIRYFVFVVKQFLAKRRMNEVHTGGLGGFAVICMVTSFLANHPRIASNDLNVDNNLGVLLIEFFELYGKSFNYYDVALCMSGNMGYKIKSQNSHLQGQNPFSLAIEDPNDPTNNLSRGSFNIRGIKKAFVGAYEALASRCYEMEFMPFKRRKGQSLLGNLIKLRGPLRDFEDSRGVIRNEAHDVQLSKAKERELEKKETKPPPAKKRKSEPETIYISDNESSDGLEDKKRSNRSTRSSRSNSVGRSSKSPVVIDSSNSDSDSDSDSDSESGSGAYDQNDDNDESDSRVKATSLDKEKKRQFWLEKSGVVAI